MTKYVSLLAPVGPSDQMMTKWFLNVLQCFGNDEHLSACVHVCSVGRGG